MCSALRFCLSVYFDLSPLAMVDPLLVQMLNPPGVVDRTDVDLVSIPADCVPTNSHESPARRSSRMARPRSRQRDSPTGHQAGTAGPIGDWTGRSSGRRLTPIRPAARAGTSVERARVLRGRIMRSTASVLISLAAGLGGSAGAGEVAFPGESNLRASVAKVDITPPEGTKVEGHPRVTHGVRDPLQAGVLLLDDGKTRAAIVTLDTLAAWNEMVAALRAGIAPATGTPGPNILVAASHNHSGPGYAGN